MIPERGPGHEGKITATKGHVKKEPSAKAGHDIEGAVYDNYTLTQTYLC